MRRICVIATALTGLALALPGVASAHHRGRHHHHHHSRTVTFAAHKTTTTSGAKTTTEPAPSGEAAGTITSFENGILKITLADGSVVSGKVTEATRIYCPAAAGSTENDENDDQGDDNGGDHHGFMGGRGDDENGGWGDGGGCGSGNCGPSSLVAGAKVGVAELVISSGGAFWEKVALTQ